MKKLLLTGVTSYSAGFFIRLLKTKSDIEIIGTARNKTSYPIKTCFVDLTKYDQINEVICKENPHYVIHLVGLTKSSDPIAFYNENLFTTVHLLESILKNKLHDTNILLFSSSAVYGFASQKLVSEDLLPRPINFYGNSKLAMEQVAMQYVHQHGLKINIVRPFNIIGVNQPNSFVIPAFARQLMDIKMGKTPPIIKVGNLDTKRDFIDIEDTVQAYWKILTSNHFGEIYNIGSGISTKISDVLDILIELLGIEITVEIDQSKYTKNQIYELTADITKISKLNWAPSISLEDSLLKILSSLHEGK